jgi:superfamily II DNA/RNA helicase/transcriptional regulator with XRE-family HTH domain
VKHAIDSNQELPMPPARPSSPVPADYGAKIKELRGRLGLTQVRLSERLGVSFATVNRWENAQSRPSPLAWQQILELGGDEEAVAEVPEDRPRSAVMDFTGRPDAIRALAEGERLSFGHMTNPVFATEIAQIDPLPHQRIAVYDHMLKQPRLRFLLADDAGAGKTIMSGLYIREMLSRRLLRRILVVPPAGLVGNWRRELSTLFSLSFRIVEGSEAASGNPFIGDDSDRVIVSVDTLSGPRVFGRLREPEVQPYDLVIFDEAHKLAADRGGDLRVRRTERYRLAEALAGVPDLDEAWTLPWSAANLLLLTATPHMGKDYPYFALWRLLNPSVISTPEAFNEYPPDQRGLHFIRRTKEEMVTLTGRPLYPTRISDTLGYALSQGEVSEQALYDGTTEYLRFIYNKAKMLNRSAARLAMSVFQRRLASSTFALLRSFERRIERLTTLIEDVQAGKITMEQIITLQRRISDDDDVFDSKTADDERSPVDGGEENEKAEQSLLQGVIAASIADLIAERDQVQELRDLAQRVYDKGVESKFEKLREVILEDRFAHEKLIVFTEHRDTLTFLVRRLNGMGYTGQVAQIHGGMHYSEREEQVEKFRKPIAEGGARFMICTDAAAEGINLQFCWVMINYDVPWNPARLEQRMGRIHRYGQQHDPVIIMNLIAPETREGKVMETLLEKLERIRKQLKSDKVFDVIGRLFQGVSIKQYMEAAVEEDDAAAVAAKLGGILTAEQVEALAEREKSLFGDGGDVKRELPRIRAEIDNEAYRRLLPGYVRQYIENAAPLVDIEIDGDARSFFSFKPARRGAIDRILPTLDFYPTRLHELLTVSRPPSKADGIWVHPGEPVFEQFRAIVSDRLSAEAAKGGVFVDPDAERPYLFHLALVSVVRDADPQMPELGAASTFESRLVGVKQFEGTELQVCPVEHLLLLKGGTGLPAAAQRLAVAAPGLRDQAAAFIVERVARQLAIDRKNRLLSTIEEREAFLRRGFSYQEAELAAARGKQAEKARSGNRTAAKELEEIKRAQRDLTARRDRAIAVIRREPELIGLAPIHFVAHALVVPSSDPLDRERHDADVEHVAMQIAWAWEESEGAVVKDVHTPELARAAGLPDYPGFDLLSVRPSGEKRGIEVKGRAATGDVELFSNEWAKACNMGPSYWLYVVYDCATPTPRRARVRDPFNRLLAKAKGSILISAKQILSVEGDA